MTSATISCVDSTVEDYLPVFDGTLVPVKELHDYMTKDWNLYGFLYQFPSVSREQALEAMTRTRDCLGLDVQDKVLVLDTDTGRIL